MLNALIRLILRHTGWVLLCSFLITLPCIYWTAQLYSNLRPDLEELLPKQSRSVKDLTEIRRRLQTIDYLAVLVFTDQPNAGKAFTIDLANRLQKLTANPQVVSAVEYKIENELKFFNARKALFLDLGDLNKIRDFISQKIDYERSLYNPINIFNNIELNEPQLDLKSILKKYEAHSSSFDHFPDGYYATPDGKKRVVLVYLPSNQGGALGMSQLRSAVVRTIAELNPKSYSSDLTIRYTGGVEVTLEELEALVNDVEKSAEIVLITVTALLYLFFRSWLATGALFISLFIARFWTFALGWFTVGYLNANSAFMGSIVLGSGITFGVILLSRYMEERRLGRIPLRAAKIAMVKTSRATITASLAASAAYGSLFLTNFEGFRQYGILGFAGMVFCWISSILIFPALLIQIEKRITLVKAFKPRKSWIFDYLCTLLSKAPGTVLLISTLITGFSIYELSHFDPEQMIETKLDHLRNKKTIETGGAFCFRYLDEIFQHYLTPIAILTGSKEQATAVEAALKSTFSDSSISHLVASVQTIDQFIPNQQPQKIAILKDIQRQLKPEILTRLSPSYQRLAKELLTRDAFQPFDYHDLPLLILNKFTEKDGSVGKLVLVEPTLTNSTWGPTEIEGLVHAMRDTVDQVSFNNIPPMPTMPIAGNLTVTSDLLEAVSEDGPRATLFAFIAVVSLVVIIFRKPSVVFLMLFALVLGNIWMFGIIIACGLKINFLNFIALPITFGIGVDYGVNIFHRYRHEPTKDILKVVRETGGAVGLCSLTTIAGYSSLLIAGNQAFVSFGRLAVLGEVTSLFAAIITLPALLLVSNRLFEAKYRQNFDLNY